MSETKNEVRSQHGQDRWPRLLGVEALAAYLGCAVQTIRNRAAQGDIPGSRKLGGRRLFDRVQIDRWLDEADDFRDLWLDGKRKSR